jgi:hypothetical protein
MCVSSTECEEPEAGTERPLTHECAGGPGRALAWWHEFWAPLVHAAFV